MRKSVKWLAVLGITLLGNGVGLGQKLTVVQDQGGGRIVIDPGDDIDEAIASLKAGAGAMTVKGTDGRQIDLAARRADAIRRQDDAMKQALGCADEEWGILGPKIRVIQRLQAVLGERPMGVGDKATTDLPPAVAALIEDLRAKQTDFHKSVAEQYPEPDIKARMASFREARERGRQELIRLRKELTDLLTTRQEAMLLQKQILN